MGRRFKDITYDLSQNLISGGVTVSSENASMIITIRNNLRKLKLVEEFKVIKVINFEDDDYLSNSQVKSLIEDLVTRINGFMPEYKVSLSVVCPYVKSTIRFVIEQIISFIKKFKVYSFEEVNYILAYLVLNQDGTVNPKQTILRIFERDVLSANRGFILATHFFLKEAAAEYYNKLSMSEQKRHWHFGKDIEEDIERYFFIYSAVESFQNLLNFLDNCIFKHEEARSYGLDVKKYDVITKHIFRKAVEHNNEIAVQYIWLNYISRTKSREVLMEEIISTYLGKVSHSNIVMYLILEVGRFELENIFNDEGYRIMKLIYDQKWIRLYFKILEGLGRHIAYDEYALLLYNIASSIENKHSWDINFEFLQRFYFHIPEGERNMLRNHENSWIIYYQLLRAPFELSHFDTVKTFLDYCSNGMIFYFLLSFYGMKLLESSIKINQFTFINNIFKRYLTKKEANEVKKKFFQLRGFELFYFHLYSDTDKMNMFLKWFSDSVNKEDIKEFKYQFPLIGNGMIVKYLLFPIRPEYSRPLLYAEKILDWCGGKDIKDKVKSKISLHSEERSSDIYPIKCYENVSKHVLQADWKFLGKLIIWTKCTKIDRHILGRKLLMDPSLFVGMQKNKDVFNYFYEFCKWVNKYLLIKEEDDEMVAFKFNVFSSIELFQPLLRRWDLSAVKKALMWCKLSVTEAKSFSKSMSRILEKHKPKTMEEQKKLDAFLKWLNSFETTIKA